MATPPAGVRIDPASLPADSNPNRLIVALAGDAEHLARGAEIDRLTRENRELREQLAKPCDACAQRRRRRDNPAPTVVGGEIDRLREWLDLRDGELASANAQRDQARAEVAQLVGVLEEVAIAHRGDADGTAYATAWLENLPDEIAEARREADEHADRLRGLLAEAVASIRAHCEGERAGAWCPTADRIHREAGL